MVAIIPLAMPEPHAMVAIIPLAMPEPHAMVWTV
jgi:hypothetical protein